MSVRVAYESWLRFWFSPGPAHTQVLVRIVFGLIILQYAWLLSPHLVSLFGTDSIVSATAVQLYWGGPTGSVLLIDPTSDAWLRMWHLTLVVAAITFTCGLLTRLSAIAIFICISAFMLRNPFVMNSGSIFMHAVSFYLCFSHGGAAFSFDRLIADSVGRKSGGPYCALVSPCAVRMIQLQTSALYCGALAVKLLGHQWIDGVALYYTLHLQEFERLPKAWLLQSFLVTKVLNYLVLFLEFACAALIWVKEFRYLVIVAGLIMHLSIEWAFNIPQFEFLTMLGLLSFIPPRDLARWQRLGQERFAVSGSATQKTIPAEGSEPV